MAEDVERAAAGAPAAAPPAAPVAEVEVEKLSQTRRTIARRLTEAWQIPVFQLAIDIDMGRALELRERLVERVSEGGAKPTITDVLTKACGAALMRHRTLNAHFVGDEVRRFPSADIGLAVAAPDGLVVPVLRGVRPRDDRRDRCSPRRRRRRGRGAGSCGARTSTAERSRSRTSACSASTSSSPS